MKNSLLIIAVLIMLLSCKKSSSTTTQTTTTTQSNAPTVLSYMLDAQGNPSGMYSGVFNMDSSYIFSSSPIMYSNFSGVTCYFFTAPQLYQNFRYAYEAKVNSVIVNGNKFGHTTVYQDTAGILISPPYKWVINGNNSIPSFTYTSTTPKPIYSGFWQIPNVISLQQNLTLPLNGASGYDMFIVQISDTATYTKLIQYSVSNTSAAVIIPKDSLAKYSSGTRVAISTTLVKFNPQSVGSKNFLFRTELEYQKNVTIQ
jgi:hypothetical protein